MTVIDSCDIDAHAAWQQRRVGPAYMRGMPTWVWQSALRGSRNRRQGETLVT
ncbi:MAG TPA: hypothetical protein VFP08_07285 [Acidimicrobiales bacterium]|jgi:hypothetical protein|nr:hypothetical protein [Acidimicrobiales bacterium]